MGEPMDTTYGSTATGGSEIQLSITRNYAGHWETWEGVREMVQNWHDGLYSSPPNVHISDDELKFKKVDLKKVAQTPSEPPQNQEAEWAKRSTSTDGSSGAVESESDCSAYYEVIYEPILTINKSKSQLVGHFCYDPPNESITMINKNIALHRRCLLLGYTDKLSKKEDKDKRASIIGQFGEGMKIGALALLRNKRHVSVQTSRDSWRFGLKQHSVLQEEVLTVFVSNRSEEQLDYDCDTGLRLRSLYKLEFDDITPPCKYIRLSEGDTCTQIWPVSQDEWNLFSKRFLFLERPSDCVDTDLGTLLLDNSLRGQLYTREIWIQDMNSEGLDTGVNIYDLELDRDRNSVTKKSDIEHRASCIWVKALKQKPALSSKYFELLTEDKSCDVRHAALYMEDRDKDIASMLMDRFYERHGENAYPIENNTPHEKIHMLQQDPKRKVVLCNKNMMKILQMSGRIPNLDEELEKLQQQKQKYVTRNELSQGESMVFEHGIRMVHMVEPEFPLDTIHISVSDGMGVLYSDDRIEIPQWMLSTEAVHAKRMNCSLPNCFCAATCLATIILQTWQGGSVNTIARHTLLTSLLATKSCDRARENYSSAGDYDKVNNQLHKQCQAKEGTRIVTEHELELIRKREKELEKSKNELQRQFDEAQRQNQRAVEDLRSKLEDVNNAYSHDEIRFDGKHEELLTKFQTERTQDKTKYESLIQLKETEKLELEKKTREATDELEHIRDDQRRLESLHQDRENIYAQELKFNHNQTKLFVQRLSQKIREIDQILKVSDDAKKNSKLHGILVDLKKDIEKSAKMDKCYVCNKEQRNCALIPCGHEDICMDCATKLKECHHCRKPIEKRLQTYS